ncbi:MAG: hypothetical protein JNK72_25090 [Myxococcales bacterium]|nr:hypothetical protein [Myxococcales bacterium]
MSLNLNKALDKKYEGQTFKQLVDMPLSGFSGLTEEHGKLLKQLGLETVGDLAGWKFAKWAQAIAALAATEEADK